MTVILVNFWISYVNFSTYFKAPKSAASNILFIIKLKSNNEIWGVYFLFFYIIVRFNN